MANGHSFPGQCLQLINSPNGRLNPKFPIDARSLDPRPHARIQSSLLNRLQSMASSTSFSASSSTGRRSYSSGTAAATLSPVPYHEGPLQYKLVLCGCGVKARRQKPVESRAKVPGNQRCVLAVLCVSLFSWRSPLLADCNAISGSGLLVNRGMMLLNRLKKEKM